MCRGRRVCVCVFFFFQAEDGIRDYKVTGVQTCALPICRPVAHAPPSRGGPARRALGAARGGAARPGRPESHRAAGSARPQRGARRREEIGRASCRERVEISVVAVSLKKKKKKKRERRER